MNTEGRVTRSRAKIANTPLAKPLDTEPRQRVSRTNKLVETPLPRKVLFDRTNEAEDPNVEAGDVNLKTEKGMVDENESSGTVVEVSKAPTATVEEPQAPTVPYEDNIVQQLLDEFTLMESSMEAENHITPFRFTTPAEKQATVEDSAEAKGPATADIAETKATRTIREEMLITPELKSALVLNGAKAEGQGTAPEEAAVEDADAANEVPADDEDNANADADDAKTTMEDGTKEGFAKSRWIMDSSPNPAQKEASQDASGMATAQRIKSVIKTTTPYDPRSLRQMKQELKSLNKAKALPGMSDSEASDSTQYTGAVCAAQAADADEARSELCQALDSLNIGPKVTREAPLRGLPVAAGKHSRFTEEGDEVDSPSRTLLRGMPAPAGSHLRFDD